MAVNEALEMMRMSQIVDTALLLISREGIEGVTMEDIARESGLSKGGIAHYFPSKDILVKETFAEFFKQVFAQSKATCDQYSDPLQKLLSFGWLYNWDDPRVNMGYPLLLECISLSARNNDFRQIMQDWIENWVCLLADAVQEGIDRGIFPVSNVKETARSISAIYHGIALRWYVDPMTHTTEWAICSFTEAITALLRRKE